MQPAKLLKLGILASLLVALTIFPGCGGTAPPVNHSPTIIILTADSSSINVNQSITITCIATDQDGDNLTYIWTKNGGTISGSGSAITWIAPATAGTYTITCTVSDGELTDGQNISIDVEQGSTTQEPELIEIASAEINLNEGGIIEVTDLENELFGVRLIIEPIMEKEKAIIDEILNVVISMGLLGTCELPEHQGYLITPIIIKAEIKDMIPGISRIEIPYNEKQLINSAVSNDTELHVLRTIDARIPWEELSPEQYIIENNVVTIPINWTDNYPGFYFYTLTVDNAIPPDPSDFKNPLPGDLLYKFSKSIPFKVNEGWLPGHVGIYVGERYDEENDEKYNVIEALLSGVQRTYYEDFSDFSHDDIYLGARESEYGLSHGQRNLIIAFSELAVGMPYALFETFTSMIYSGLGKGDWVKGDGNFNCVGLAEAAYEYAGIDLVSDYDEGNQEWSAHDILTPAEQWYSTVPATGVIYKNIPPEISEVEMIPGSPVEIGSQVTITCNATDQDQDILTYEWSVPNEIKPIIRGKQLDLQLPSVAGNYEISCRVFDNYGGDDTKTIDITVGPPPPAEKTLKSLTVVPDTMNFSDVGQLKDIQEIILGWSDETTSPLAEGNATYSGYNTSVVKKVSAIPNIKFESTGEGDTQIKVSYTDSNNVTKSGYITVHVEVEEELPPIPEEPTLYDPGSSVSSGTSYTVSWSDESASGATRYSLMEYTSKGASKSIDTVSGTSKTFTHDVSTDTIYYYQVASWNDNTNEGSEYSNEVDMKVLASPPSTTDEDKIEDVIHKYCQASSDQDWDEARSCCVYGSTAYEQISYTEEIWPR